MQLSFMNVRCISNGFQIIRAYSYRRIIIITFKQ